MRCPKCGAEMKTTDSVAGEGVQVRLRECSEPSCKYNFFTEERQGDPHVYRRLKALEKHIYRQRKIVSTGTDKVRPAA